MSATNTNVQMKVRQNINFHYLDMTVTLKLTPSKILKKNLGFFHKTNEKLAFTFFPRKFACEKFAIRAILYD